MTGPLRILLVGAGSVAATHAEALAAAPGLRLVGVHARDPARCAAFAATHGIAAFASFADGLDRADAVAIATPSGTHAELARQALSAGKHVIVEKPIDIDLAKVDALIAAARARGLTLACLFQQRFTPAAQALKAAVEAGRFGRLTIGSAATTWWRDAAYYADGGWRGTWALDGGGALINQGIHAVDLLQWLVGSVVEVGALTGRAAHPAIEVEDTAVAALRFANGAHGTLLATTAAWPGQPRRIEVCGTTGSAVLVDDRLVEWRFATAAPGDAAVRMLGAGDPGSGAAQAVKAANHRAAFVDFAAAIRHRRPPAVDGEEARRSLATVLAVYAAARSGATVRVEPRRIAAG